MAKKKNIPLEDIVDLHNQGLYDSEIAKILGCKRENIVKRLENDEKLSIKFNYSGSKNLTGYVQYNDIYVGKGEPI